MKAVSLALTDLDDEGEQDEELHPLDGAVCLPTLRRQLDLHGEHERRQHHQPDDVRTEQRVRSQPARPDRGRRLVPVGRPPQPRVVKPANTQPNTPETELWPGCPACWLSHTAKHS